MNADRMPPTLRFLLAARRCELHGLQALAGTCELVDLTSRLIHALQKERGYSNLYLCSARDSLPATLAALIDEAIAAEKQVRRFLGSLEPASAHTGEKARLLNAIAHALYRLDELPRLRSRIRERRVPAQDAAERFTCLVASLMAVVAEAADSALDAAVTRILVALLNFMQGKELAGQERAFGVMGFTAGYFDAGQKTRMDELAAAQQRAFDVFAAYAPPQALQGWEQVARQGGEILRMRAMVARTSQAQAVDPALAGLWFDLCTARIDAMRTVESLLADALAHQCRQRIEQTRAELDNHRLLLDRFADHASGKSPAMVFSVQGRILDVPPQDGVGSGMQRSLLDLMQEQTLRLQRSDEALAAARITLDERRDIERAKWLLVSRHGMSEQDALERLQRAAMDGRVPLRAVAQQVLAQRSER